jgi:hypothetical protein
MRRHGRGRAPVRLLRVAVALALLGALGGVAYAATSSSFVGPHGNINGCVPRNGGGLNLWKPGHRCSGGRVAVAFPVRAAAGVSGPTGPSGPTGATGPSNSQASSVDGQTVTKLTLREATPATGTTAETLFSGDGLTILAQCDSTGAASLVANGPASADSVLTVSGHDNAGTPAFGSQTASLGPASLVALGPASAGEASFSYASNAGQVVTGSVGYEHSPSFGSFAGCAFFGTVISG